MCVAVCAPPRGHPLAARAALRRSHRSAARGSRRAMACTAHRAAAPRASAAPRRARRCAVLARAAAPAAAGAQRVAVRVVWRRRRPRGVATARFPDARRRARARPAGDAAASRRALVLGGARRASAHALRCGAAARLGHRVRQRSGRADARARAPTCSPVPPAGLALALSAPAARAAIVDDVGYVRRGAAAPAWAHASVLTRAHRPTQTDRSNTRLPGECALGAPTRASSTLRWQPTQGCCAQARGALC